MPFGDGPERDEGTRSSDLPSGHALDPTPRVKIKRRWYVIGSAMIFLTVLVTVWGEAGRTAGPTAPRAFCRAAESYENEINRQAIKHKVDVGRQIVRVEALAATAPRKIQADAQVFLDAMQRVQDDPSLRGNPEVKRAVDNVNRYASLGCGVFNRQSGI